ncbi:putative Transmembrane protein [Heracleum sosnowskyi]|uniref:Transmembrane protein n=1 Tax=Heracleum sosnowskyi TaxID=360622 RepID=A0AAD8HD55_9APIA|nr:putative Transmembrane protein [Heracleum sosnowskyi]
MAFRSSNCVKSVIGRLRIGASPSSAFTTSTTPKLNPQTIHADQSANNPRSVKRSGEWVPVYVAVGLILLSAGFGVHTVIQQIGRAPGVYVKKSRRESVPEVDDPDQQLEYADRFMNKSFFRKIAHVQDYDLPHNNMPDPIHDDVYAKKPRSETLKSVGVDTKSH